MKLYLVTASVLMCVSTFCNARTWSLVTTSIDSGTSALHSLSIEDASATLIAPIDAPVIVAALAYSGDGVLYGTATDNRQLYEIDISTGRTISVGELPITLPHGLAFDDATESLFATFGDGEENNLYRVYPQTAATELIGAISFAFDPERHSISALDFHPSTGVLYGAFAGPTDFGALVTIDTQSAEAVLIGFSHRLTAIAFHPETGVLYGVDNGTFGGGNSSLYQVDTATGAATLIGTIPLDNTLGLEFVLLVPEPNSACLVCLAMVSAVAVVRLSPHLRKS